MPAITIHSTFVKVRGKILPWDIILISAEPPFTMYTVGLMSKDPACRDMLHSYEDVKFNYKTENFPRIYQMDVSTNPSSIIEYVKTITSTFSRIVAVDRPTYDYFKLELEDLTFDKVSAQDLTMALVYRKCFQDRNWYEGIKWSSSCLMGKERPLMDFQYVAHVKFLKVHGKKHPWFTEFRSVVPPFQSFRCSTLMDDIAMTYDDIVRNRDIIFEDMSESNVIEHFSMPTAIKRTYRDISGNEGYETTVAAMDLDTFIYLKKILPKVVLQSRMIEGIDISLAGALKIHYKRNYSNVYQDMLNKEFVEPVTENAEHDNSDNDDENMESENKNALKEDVAGYDEVDEVDLTID